MAKKAPRSVEAEQDEALAWEARKAALCRSPIVIGAAELLRHADVKPSMLVEASIPAGAITLIVGEPGAKKSWLAYSLAIATARSSEWLGRRATPQGRTSNVLVLNYDNPTPECGRRFKRLGLTEQDSIFFHSVEIDPLRLPECTDDVRAIVAELKPSLVIADSFRQSHDADENSSKEMAEVMGSYKSLCANGCAVVIVHHAGKGALTTGVGKARGSGEIPASADAMIVVAKSDDADVDLATWEKHRSWALSDLDATQRFRLIDEGDSTRLELEA